MSDEVEQFQKFLEQGGQSYLEEVEAKRKAQRKQMIKNGDINFVDLLQLLQSRVDRMEKFLEMGVPLFIIGHEVELLERAIEEIQLSFKHTLEEQNDA